MSLDVPGVDLAVLRGWMDARGLGEGDLTGLELIAGGTQNVLLRFTRAGRTYVQIGRASCRERVFRTV